MYIYKILRKIIITLSLLISTRYYCGDKQMQNPEFPPIAEIKGLRLFVKDQSGK